MLPPDIEQYIARTFDAADREAALTLCRSATLHDGSPGGPRLIRCALVASQGALEKLRREIDHLKVDYRDVILGAEYVSKGETFERVRDLNEPFT